MWADVHSHLLPGIDDGARSERESAELLASLQKCGVTHLALTPHYYPYKRSVSSFTEKRSAAYARLQTLPIAAQFHFALGAEVYLSETLLNNEDLTPLCYEGTRFMLTELEYTESFSDATRFRLVRLVEDFHVTPILAHIDRYPFLWKDEERLAQLRDLGCLFQMNLSALDSFFSRRRASHLAEKGFIDFLGEDVHHSVMAPEKKEKLLSALQKRSDQVERLSRAACTSLFSR